MTIYTKRGDKGYTGLYGDSGRYLKSSTVFEVLGGFDELSSSLGMLITEQKFHFSENVRILMNDLFNLASFIAGVNSDENTAVVYDEKVSMMEGAISTMEKSLPPLKNFILPGGCEESARLHNSRVTCRNLERKIVSYISYQDTRGSLEFVLRYVNRLSDYLFTLARMSNFKNGVSDVELKS